MRGRRAASARARINYLQKAALRGVFLLFAPSACCCAAELAVIRDKAFVLPGMLQSYQFNAESRRTTAGRGGPAVNRVAFYQSGNSLRSECERTDRKSGSRDAALCKVITAYNGSRYQTFFEDPKILTFSNTCRFKNPYWLPNPLILPYVWLSNSPGINWSELKNYDMWVARFNEARYKHLVTERGVTNEVISLPYADKASGVRVDVYLAAELGYYPLRYMAYDAKGNQVLSVRVTDYTFIDADGGRVVFPLGISIKEESPPTIDDWTIQKHSIKVNHPIEEDLFTLSPSMARIVDDYDRNIAEQKNVLQPGAAFLPPRSRWRAWFVGGNVLVLIVLVCAFWYRQFRRRGLKHGP